MALNISFALDNFKAARQRLEAFESLKKSEQHLSTALTCVYMQELPEGVAETVNAINRELRKKPKKSKATRVAENLLPNATKSATTENGSLSN
jgi:hypothetical protein